MKSRMKLWQIRLLHSGRIWLLFGFLGSVLAWAIPVHGKDLAQAASNSSTFCRELVINGDFQQVGPGWSLLAGEYLPQFTRERAFVADGESAEGQQALLLGSLELPNAQTTSAVEQVITIPAGVESAILSFRYFPVYEGTPGPGDEQYVQVIDRTEETSVIQVLSSQLNLDRWLFSQYDLRSLAGREVRLVFGVRNDGQGGRIAMYLDDVSVQACGQVFAPTPTAIPPTATLPPAEAPVNVPSPPEEPTPTPSPTPEVIPPASALCDCRRDLYRCSEFPSWSAAQACYDRCRVQTGIDVHLLDEDGDGVVCELASQDDATLDTASLDNALVEGTDTESGLAAGVVSTGTATGTLPPAAPATETVTTTFPTTGALESAPGNTTEVPAAVAQISATGAVAAETVLSPSVGSTTGSSTTPVETGEPPAAETALPLSVEPNEAAGEETGLLATSPTLALLRRMLPLLTIAGVVIVLLVGGLLAWLLIRTRRLRSATQVSPEPYTVIENPGEGT